MEVAQYGLYLILYLAGNLGPLTVKRSQKWYKTPKLAAQEYVQGLKKDIWS